MLLDAAAMIAGLLFGTLLERRFLGQRLKRLVVGGGGICLIGFIVGFVTRGSALSSLSFFIVMLGVPALSGGLWLLNMGQRPRKPGKPAV